jgi:hypothetical protein
MQKRLSLLLFLLALVVFNLNLRPGLSADTIPTSLLPFSIVTEHRLTLDRYYEWYAEHHRMHPYYFTVTRGHVYSSYPVALPLLVTPLYVPFLTLLHVQDWPVERIVPLAESMEKLVASVLAAVSVAVFYSFLRRLVNWKAA